MDFTNGGGRVDATPTTNNAASTRKVHAEKPNKEKDDKWRRIGLVGALLAVTILIIGSILVISSSNKNTPEDNYVDTSKLQAVFLNTGQVYFGNIKVLNSKYYVLTNVYYLQTSISSAVATASTSASNVSLGKLSCEPYRPYNQMVINTDDVTSWENLQSSGEIATAVATFQKDNPDGQTCNGQTAAASTTNGAATKSAITSSPAATPTSNSDQ